MIALTENEILTQLKKLGIDSTSELKFYFEEYIDYYSVTAKTHQAAKTVFKIPATGYVRSLHVPAQLSEPAVRNDLMQCVL